MVKNQLNLYYEDRLIGILEFDPKRDEFSFRYDKEWIEDGFKISPHFEFKKKIDSSTIKKFLDNLLPEGKALEIFSLFFQLTKNNTIALIREIGNETSGAITFFEDRPEKIETIKREIDIKELTSRIEFEDPIQLIIWDGKPRLSVAGVQDKLPIMYEDGLYSFGEGDLASTHILKFENSNQRYLVLNEYICMKLAKEIGLNTAEVEIKRFGSKAGLLVKRFDRVRVKDRVKRVHIFDGCQALNLASTHKYERNFGSKGRFKDIKDGVSFKKLFEFSQLCKNPIKTKLSILQWALYNLIISNSDAHGKNISFFSDKNGYELAPHYDMVNIAMYQEFEQELSMGFGDDFTTEISRDKIESLCRSCSINPRLAYRELKELSNRVLKTIKRVNFTEIATDEKERDFIMKSLTFIEKRAKDSYFIV